MLSPAKVPRKQLPIAEARANAFDAFSGDWANYQVPTPKQTGIVEYKNVPIATLRRFIDWAPFFRLWGLMGGYPDAFDYWKAVKKLAACTMMLKKVLDNWSKIASSTQAASWAFSLPTA